MRCVIYARYSSDNQREESIEGQIRECMDYAKRKGWQVIESYIDRAMSAKTDDRPSFQKMIKDSAKKLFDIVLVWKLDRFARNRYDSAKHKNTLKKNDVRVVSARESISDGPEGIILESVLEGMAEYYSADLAEKVIRGHTENALKNKFNGGSVAFGLMLDDDLHYVPDPEKAPIVLEIFKRYAGGETMKQLVDDLDQRGIRGIRGNKIGLDAMRHLLSNRKYIGEYQYRDIVTENAFPAIVPKELFEEVQQVRKVNKKAPARHKAEDKYLLATKVFCGDCGSPMDGECGHSSTKVRYNYYKCLNAKRKKGCHRRAIPKDKLERLVVEEAVRRLKSEDFMEQVAQAVMDYQSSENVMLPALERQLAEVNQSIENMVNAIQNGMFHHSMKKRMDELEAEQSRLEVSILQEKIKRPTVTKEQVKEWLTKCLRYDGTSMSQRQKLIDCFIRRVQVYPDHIQIFFHYSADSASLAMNSSDEEPFLSGCSDMSGDGGYNCSWFLRKSAVFCIKKLQGFFRTRIVPEWCKMPMEFHVTGLGHRYALNRSFLLQNLIQATRRDGDDPALSPCAGWREMGCGGEVRWGDVNIQDR